MFYEFYFTCNQAVMACWLVELLVCARHSGWVGGRPMGLRNFVEPALKLVFLPPSSYLSGGDVASAGVATCLAPQLILNPCSPMWKRKPSAARVICTQTCFMCFAVMSVSHDRVDALVWEFKFQVEWKFLWWWYRITDVMLFLSWERNRDQTVL